MFHDGLPGSKGVTAVSYIELNFGAGAAEPPEEIIDFVLDHPFVFDICTDQIPLFVGTVNLLQHIKYRYTHQTF